MLAHHFRGIPMSASLSQPCSSLSHNLSPLPFMMPQPTPSNSHPPLARSLRQPLRVMPPSVRLLPFPAPILFTYPAQRAAMAYRPLFQPQSLMTPQSSRLLTSPLPFTNLVLPAPASLHSSLRMAPPSGLEEIHLSLPRHTLLPRVWSQLSLSTPQEQLI